MIAKNQALIFLKEIRITYNNPEITANHSQIVVLTIA